MNTFYRWELYNNRTSGVYTDGEVNEAEEAILEAYKAVKEFAREGDWKVEIIECRSHQTVHLKSDMLGHVNIA